MQEAGSAAEPTPLCVYTEDGPASTQAGARHVTQEASSDKMDKMLTAGTSDADTRPLPVTEAPRGGPRPAEHRRTVPAAPCPPPAPQRPHRNRTGAVPATSCALFGGGGVSGSKRPQDRITVPKSHTKNIVRGH